MPRLIGTTDSKWVSVCDCYFNANAISSFCWCHGCLRIAVIDGTGVRKFEDSRKIAYKNLCEQLGLPPMGGDSE